MSFFPRKWRAIAQYLSLFLVGCFLVISCGKPNTPNPNNSTTTPTVNQSNTGAISIGTTIKPRTMDPADAYEMASLNIIYNMSDYLYTYEVGTTKLVPQLATELPKISADGLTYTIPLKKGVLFHDGNPFNAEAMAFSIQRFIENKGKPSFLLSDIVASVKATSEYELTIKLKKPFGAFTSLLAFYGVAPLSPKAYQIGAGKFQPNQFIGTGPYKLVKFTSDAIQLEVFDKYWGEKPKNKAVNIQVLTSGANLFGSFKTGAVDVAYLSLDPDQIENLKQSAKSGSWQAVEAKGSAISYMGLNLKQKPLDKLEVRQAIAYLIDRNLINQRVLKGQAEALYSLVPTTFDMYKPSFKEVYGEGDFEKAKQLLEKAGYSATNPLKLQIWYPSSSGTRRDVALTLKALAEQKLGGILQFEPNNVESASFFKNVGKGLYPTFLLDWYPDFLDADNYIQPFTECAKGSVANGCEEGASQSQGSFYFNEQLNKLISAQRQEQNPEARKKIFAQLQDLIAKDVPYIPLWQNKDFIFTQKNISGAGINPTQTLPFWTITKK